MIRSVTIRRFKRFQEQTFEFGGKHIVLAGPNNCGKSTVLQAIAAWSFALEKWRSLNNFLRRGGAYEYCPVTRQVFSVVPLRTLELLWTERTTAQPIQIELQSMDGGKVTIEFVSDTSEQILVRPTKEATPETVRRATLQSVLVPPMSGLSVEEPVFRTPKIEQLLGQSRPGEVIRNLLLLASREHDAWDALKQAIAELFNFELLVPDDSGPDILAEYRKCGTEGPRYDIASAGSGFQQVLMLLTFLHTRKGSVLLVDEPDAHLHVFLQDAIFGRLYAAAVKSKSQLIVATHSEVMIDAVALDQLRVLVDQPISISTEDERRRLQLALRVVDNVDIMNVQIAPGILYLEGRTDLAILRAIAKVMNHPVLKLLGANLFWRIFAANEEKEAQQHFDALRLARGDLRALRIVDGDARPEIQQSEVTGVGYQRIRWRRYEIESYLLHPAALDRFVEVKVGQGSASERHRADLRKHFEDTYPPAFLRDPFEDLEYLSKTKARTALLPPALTAAGLPGFPHDEYYQIAELMLPTEVHPEVKEKLDLICKAFGIDVAAPSEP